MTSSTSTESTTSCPSYTQAGTSPRENCQLEQTANGAYNMQCGHLQPRSAHCQNVGDSLYQHTRRSLETLDSKNTKIEFMDLEQVQAWLLLAIHEFMCVDFRRGWMSAGRAFRLIQLSWRHGTDRPDQAPGDWIESEQKRRTFWMAYCLDRFVSMRIGSPLTFSETVSNLLTLPEIS